MQNAYLINMLVRRLWEGRITRKAVRHVESADAFSTSTSSPRHPQDLYVPVLVDAEFGVRSLSARAFKNHHMYWRGAEAGMVYLSKIVSASS